MALVARGQVDMFGTLDDRSIRREAQRVADSFEREFRRRDVFGRVFGRFDLGQLRDLTVRMRRGLGGAVTSAGTAAGAILGSTILGGMASLLGSGLGQIIATSMQRGLVEVERKVVHAQISRFNRESSRVVKGLGSELSSGFWKSLFTPNRAVLMALRTGIPAVLASPVGIAAIALGATFAAGFIGAAVSTFATGGLGAAIMAAGVAGLIAMDEQVKQRAENMVETLKAVFARAIRPLAGPLQVAFGLIERGIKRMEPALTRLFSRVGPALENFTRGLIGLVENMLPGFERSMAGVNAVFRALAVHLPMLGTAIGDFFAHLAKDPELLERSTGLVVTFMRQMLKVGSSVLEGLMVVHGAIANVWRLITMGTSTATTAVGQFFDSLVGPRFEPVKKTWGELWEAIGRVWETLREFAKANTDEEIRTKFVTLLERLGEAWDKFRELVGRLWTWAWENVKRIWQQNVEPWLKDKLSAFLDWLIAEVRTKLGDMVTEAAKELAKLPLKVAAAFAGLPATIGLELGRSAASAFWGGVEIMESLIRGITSRQGALGGAVGRAAAQAAQVAAGVIAGRVPGFAEGGRTPANQPFWVGERGPELMSFNRPMHVTSHEKSMRMVEGSAGKTVNVTQYISTQEIDPRVTAAKLGFELAGRL